MVTPDVDVGEAERRLREWGWQCGAYLDDEAQRRPYRDTKIKALLDVGKAWKQSTAAREARRARRDARRAAARRAAETRRRIRENKFTVCDRCNLLFFSASCPRCAGDPLYTALAKQTRDNQPNLDGPVLRITAEAAQVDEIVGRLPRDMRTLLKRCYCDGRTPWRAHAWSMGVSWERFEELHEQAVEAVAERLAKRFDAVV